MAILVTGGAGFIGSNFVRTWTQASSESVVNLDKLTYAANPLTLEVLNHFPQHNFVQGDICDATLLERLFREHRPRAVIHFAAESHVDRSISTPEAFLKTNITGTYELLRAARAHYEQLTGTAKEEFRFLHVSTDEVYGTLEPDDPPFHEGTPYAPNSPYAATKAASDHLVRAWQHTFAVPTLTTNCSNNYGPYQFPEKLIPLMLHNALAGKPLPVYGDGQQVRDWLFVEDHCSAIRRVLERGRIGETYNIGGCNQRTNLDVIHMLCDLLEELAPSLDRGYRSLITYVTDRPGHDRRYAIDMRKIERELEWRPAESFESGLRRTVEWYLANPAWVESISSGEYRRWLDQNYASRETLASASLPGKPD